VSSLELRPDTRIVAITEQVSCDLAGEAAILSLRNGTYYGLDRVGARIWNLIQQPRTVKEILDTLLAEYDVDAERCAADLQRLLTELTAQGLVEEAA